MADNTRVKPNAFDLLLLQAIIRIRSGIGDKAQLRDKDYTSMTSVGASTGRLRKLFGAPSDDPKTRTLEFSRSYTDALIAELGLESVTNWDKFKKKFDPWKFGFTGREAIPKGFPRLLNIDYRRLLAKTVEKVLITIFSEQELKNFDVYKIVLTESISIPDKLAAYLNTTWYAYFYFTYSTPNPEILRTIITIGDTPDQVRSRAILNNKRLNNFEGNVALDKGATTLVFNMVTEELQERWIHIKMIVGTTNRPPEIALAEYNNIGVNGIGAHSIRLVMEYLPPEEAKEAFPHIFRAGDEEMKTLEPCLREYVRYERDNWRHTPKDTVLSYRDLERHIREQKNERYVNRRVRFEQEIQVGLCFPRYGMQQNDYETTINFINEIEEIITNNRLCRLHSYYTRQSKDNLPFPRDYDFYSDRIEECELLIFFLFRHSMECLIELAIAVERGKEILIFTTVTREFLPPMLQVKTPGHVSIRSFFSDMKNVGQWFIVSFDDEIKDLCNKKFFNKEADDKLPS